MKIKKRLQSFAWAMNGILYSLKTQWNMRVHLLAVIVVVGAGFCFDIKKWEWSVVLLCCASVISLELINTAIETLADKLHPEHDKQIGIVKDVAAAAVLMVSIFAAVTGLLIFVPYLLSV